MSRLVDALLDESPGTRIVTDPYPQVYQLYIYNRRSGQTKPDWTAPLYLNRLERHRSQYQLQSTDSLRIADAQSSNQTTELSGQAGPDSPVAPAWQQDAATTALVLSNLSLARQGDPEAIAWYLSEVLSTLDVGVWVSIRAVPGQAAIPQQEEVHDETAETSSENERAIPRLWILCEAAYSPDPLLIAEPVTERLRKLSLTQFRDAVIVIQVQGEEHPDWSLRVDLTPPEEMLREWGRWGDAEAIAQLVQHALSPWHIQVTAEPKAESIYLIVQTAAMDAPNQPLGEEPAMAAIAPLLERLAPQGIQRAMVYGQGAQTKTPAWVHCLDLPALEHPALAATPQTLARRGDLPALTYLLMRRLNPDQKMQLTTGGTRVKVLRRDQLLHIMADAPVCPARRRIVPTLLSFLESLELQGINGIRIYGRRAGQQRPAWSYGRDFAEGQRIVPKAEPVFAASDAYLGDLLTPTEEDVLRPDLTSEDVKQAWRLGWTHIKQFLFRTHLFLPQSDLPRVPPPIPASDRHHALKTGFVWGLVGILLALQVDWLLGQVLNPATQSTVAGAAPLPKATIADQEEASTYEATPTDDAPRVDRLEDLEPASSPSNWHQEDWVTDDELITEHNGLTEAESDGFTEDAPFNDPWDVDTEDEFADWDRDEDGFLAEDFTQSSDPETTMRPFTEELLASPERSLVATPTLLSNSPYPSFRSQQLDEKLALYHERLQEVGPPDVLIIGSSRALRGVDPAALQQELMALGFGKLSIFNFGVNGSTAQVVDLTIRRILETEQLPRLILWADGARAFNSGRTDVTYNAIATSEGYIELGKRYPELSETDAALANFNGEEGGNANAPQSVGDTLRDSYQALDQKLSERLGQWSAIHAERERLKAFLRDQILAPLVAPITVPLATESLDQNSSADRTLLNLPEGSRIDFDGFLALDVRFNPATYYQLYARVQGLYDSDYEEFGLQGEQLVAFQRLLEYTQDLNIPVVLVNTPLTDEYLDDYRMEAEEAFQQLMLQLSVTEDEFVFRDLGQLWTDRYNYFSDPSHLNRYGAYQVSNRLAQDPMIPWPEALAPPVLDPEALP